MKRFTIFIAVLTSLGADAQEIAGKITDHNGVPVSFGVVQIKQRGRLKQKIKTDYYGFYLIKPPLHGPYEVTTYYAGHDTVTVKGVVVALAEPTTINFDLKQSEGRPKHTVESLKTHLVVQRKIDSIRIAANVNAPMEISDIAHWNSGGCHGRGPLAIGGRRTNAAEFLQQEPTKPGNKADTTDRTASERHIIVATYCPCGEILALRTLPVVFTPEEVKNIAATDLRDAIATLPMVYQRQRGTDVNIAGAGPYGTLYVIDGIQMAR